MQEICPKCGLPKDLCVCETIIKDTQKITVTTDHRRFGKTVTLIRGIDESSINLKDLAKKLKSALACGGTVKDGMIILQGDHEKRVRELLVKYGFPEENIE